METERQAIAADWKDRFGDDIGCNELRNVASRTSHSLLNLSEATASALEGAAGVLRAFSEARDSLLEQQLPGMNASLYSLQADVGRSIKADAQDGLIPPIASVEDSTSDWHHVARVLSLPEAIGTRALESELRRRASIVKSGGKQLRRAPELAFGRSCFEISEWIRARRPDGTTSWRDVVECLRWYGHDLSHQTQPYKAAEQAAKRYLKRGDASPSKT